MNAPWAHLRGSRELGSKTSSLYCNHHTQIIASIKVSSYDNVWHAHLHECPPLYAWECVCYCACARVCCGKWEMENPPHAEEGFTQSYRHEDFSLPVRSEFWILNTLDISPLKSNIAAHVESGFSFHLELVGAQQKKRSVSVLLQENTFQL